MADETKLNEQLKMIEEALQEVAKTAEGDAFTLLAISKLLGELTANFAAEAIVTHVGRCKKLQCLEAALNSTDLRTKTMMLVMKSCVVDALRAGKAL